MAEVSKIQPKDKVVPFFKKCVYLVSLKLSLEVVPFCKTQANSGGLSTTMFLSAFFVFSCVQLGLRYLLMLGVSCSEFHLATTVKLSCCSIAGCCSAGVIWRERISSREIFMF